MKKKAPPKRRPTAKQLAACIMTREEFERTEPSPQVVAWSEDMDFVMRGLPSSLRPLTDEEVVEMRHHIVRDSVGAASRLLVEVKRMRFLANDTRAKPGEK